MQKRSIVIEGNTPGKPASKKRSSTDSSEVNPHKELFSPVNDNEPSFSKKSNLKWSDVEIRYLVEYVALYWDRSDDSLWPQYKNVFF